MKTSAMRKKKKRKEKTISDKKMLRIMDRDIRKYKRQKKKKKKPIEVLVKPLERKKRI